ncbi:MAG TPA: Rieske 2Fe-2S domain-containing protein [Polyangia bacterium]|nr:Rieske 2Fe-2S domain-containing protein [Polyangia bacterium]
MAFKPALRAEELWIGEMTGVRVAGQPVLLVNVEGKVSAFEDRCRHRALPLSLGTLAEGRLICRAHAWEYDACTGAGVNPAGVCLRRYEVRIADGEILVDVDDAA